MRLPLPSEVKPQREEDRLLLSSPSAEHCVRSGEAMASLASAASSSPSSSPPLEVKISHADNQGFLSPRLYGFHLEALGNDGTQVDAIGSLRRVHFVSLLNQPVARQIESMVTLLAQLVERQRRIRDLREAQSQTSAIDVEVAAADDSTANAVVDVLRHGWRAAAEMVGRNALDLDIPLRISYEPDPIPDPSLLANRVSALKRAYNNLPEARDAIDRLVSRATMGGMIVADATTPERVRAYLQQHFRLSGVTHYLAQALRDGFVQGNGYLTYTDGEPIGVYNLQPATTTLSAQAGYAHPSPSQDAVPVIHVRGMSQPYFRYGLGILEVVLGKLFQQEVFKQATTTARQILAEGPDIGRGWAHETIAQAERVKAASSRAMIEILSPLKETLPPPSPGLYFGGCERL